MAPIDPSGRKKKISSPTDQPYGTVAHRDPSAIKNYLEEKDRYRAFLAGHRQKEDDNGQATIRELQSWSKAWKDQSGDRNSKHEKPKL